MSLWEEEGEFSYFIAEQLNSNPKRIYRLTRNDGPPRCDDEFTRYLYHTTRGHLLGKVRLSITEVRKATRWIASFYEHKININRFQEEAAKVHRKSRKKYKVFYALIKSSSPKLTSEGDSEIAPYFAGCIFMSRDEILEAGLLIEQYPIRSLDYRYRSEDTSKDDTFEIEASYVQPSWFQQRLRDHIVFPKENVSDVFTLTLKLRDQESTKLFLDEVFIDLTLMVFYPSGKRRFFCTNLLSTKLYHQNGDYQIEKLQKTSEVGTTIVTIPKALLSCLIPSLPPTFSDNEKTLTYAIRFTVELRNRLDLTFWAKSVVHVSVAGTEPISAGPCKHLQQREQGHSSAMIYFLDKQRIERFDPHLSAKALFMRLDESRIRLHAFETVTFTSKSWVTSLTKVAFQTPSSTSGPSLSSWMCRMNAELNELNFGYEVEPKDFDHLILAKTFRVQIDQLQGVVTLGCPVVLEEDMAFPTVFTFGKASKDDEVKAQNLSTSSSPENAFSISLKFRTSSSLVQRSNEYIVTPGMFLKDFLELRVALRAEAAHDSSKCLIITRSKIFLSESHIATSNDSACSPLVSHRRTKSMMLAEKPFNLKVSQESSGRVRNPQHLSTKIEEVISDVRVPQVGPTYFTNFLTRTYHIIVRVSARVNTDCEVVLEASHPINIATSPEDLPSANIAPPIRRAAFVAEFLDRSPGYFRFKRAISPQMGPSHGASGSDAPLKRTKTKTPISKERNSTEAESRISSANMAD